jgi:hypothetical protein
LDFQQRDNPEEEKREHPPLRPAFPLEPRKQPLRKDSPLPGSPPMRSSVKRIAASEIA